ncbi:hypothetical protein CF160_00145 [Enterococcus pseudoavium]|nr:hypothetical protein CF160_00145 [Enterococcus pseudoavium]
MGKRLRPYFFLTKFADSVLIDLLKTETRDHAIEKLSECWKLQTDIILTVVKGSVGRFSGLA